MGIITKTNQTVKCFKYRLGFFLLSGGLLVGCEAVSEVLPREVLNHLPKSLTNSLECPEMPRGSLSNPEAIAIDSQNFQGTGIVRSGEDTGFVFSGEKGKLLSYRYNEGVCVWIYAPDNSLVLGNELPLNGRYTVHVASLGGTRNFEIEMSLSAPVAAVPPPAPARTATPTAAPAPARTATPAPTPTATQTRTSTARQRPERTANDTGRAPRPQRQETAIAPFRRSDFPKSSCGDRLPTNRADYPIRFYPVNVPDSESNLQRTKAIFCRDAYRRYRHANDDYLIQVASFNSRSRAEAFARMVNEQVSGASVGVASVINAP
ncbi:MULTISPECIES: hypothetical protein [unclassified Limnospira]|uniref:hypothetical protein n=1 Tax=unclassified Limnospira TaxID=2642885 RepID=UPI0028E11C72|nr:MULTISPECIES: hypothetical protein [unclassified Limnospira]MDT9186371.1 hypothetical protein [Limnospira sp. PMC 894.15]MDT9196748.1 hypothetical protein [Limnospira sp. PMC 1042.18]MDT9273012.1 hypothetical protein [Limnospira sp. PMC 737.11]